MTRAQRIALAMRGYLPRSVECWGVYRDGKLIATAPLSTPWIDALMREPVTTLRDAPHSMAFHDDYESAFVADEEPGYLTIPLRDGLLAVKPPRGTPCS